ncbi:MAG TPA: lysophospholipase [Gemmatimonadales bacterium]|jgi:alpha-beta hydrolase superfamily lysophospholipase|nr:lysophospholipase [Gemmatimonadales bacterium]
MMVGGVPLGEGEDAGPATVAQAHSQGWFAGAGGLSLFRQTWRPAGRPRAALLNIHGLGDHSGLYPTLVDHCMTRRLVVHSHDLRGNGRSPGQRAYVERWEEYREDLARFVATVRSEEGDLPLFLLGNSLGGLIALDYALHHPDGLRGVVAASPPLGRLGVPAPLLALGRVLSRVWPRFSIRTGMDLSGLARDPAVVEQVLADPLFHRVGTARLSTEVAAAIARVQEGAPRFPLPLLVLHGSEDRMVPPDGSRSFVPRVGHPDHQLREYPGAYHVLFADLDRERVLTDLEQWIVARL